MPDPEDKYSNEKSSNPASTREPPEPASPLYRISSATNLKEMFEPSSIKSDKINLCFDQLKFDEDVFSRSIQFEPF